jgi:AcrR family transcriptional regulator
MISRDFVTAHRRRRFVLAAAEVAGDFGRAAITTTILCQVAHTSRNTFYETFGSVDDCLRCGAGEAYEEIFAPVRAVDPEGEWICEVERAIVGLYKAVAAEPLLAELFFVHSFALGDGGEAGCERGIAAVVNLLAPGRPLAEALGRRPPPLAEELVARTILALAAQKVGQGAAAELPSEAAPMAQLVAGAFLGEAAASGSRQPFVS